MCFLWESLDIREASIFGIENYMPLRIIAYL